MRWASRSRSRPTRYHWPNRLPRPQGSTRRSSAWPVLRATVVEADRVLRVHAVTRSSNAWPRRPDARLDAGGEFGLGRGRLHGRSLRTASGQRSRGRHAPKAAPRGSGRCTLRGSGWTSGSRLAFLADPVARRGRSSSNPSPSSVTVSTSKPNCRSSPLSRSNIRPKAHRGAVVVVDLFAQFAAPEPVLGVQQRDEQVQEAFST